MRNSDRLVGKGIQEFQVGPPVLGGKEPISMLHFPLFPLHTPVSHHILIHIQVN